MISSSIEEALKNKNAKLVIELYSLMLCFVDLKNEDDVLVVVRLVDRISEMFTTIKDLESFEKICLDFEKKLQASGNIYYGKMADATHRIKLRMNAIKQRLQDEAYENYSANRRFGSRAHSYNEFKY